MTFEIKLVDSGDFTTCSVDIERTLAGERVIELGGNLKEGRLLWKEGYGYKWLYKRYPSVTYDELIERCLEQEITHECLHILCAQLAPEEERRLAGDGIDYLDRRGEISGV